MSLLLFHARTLLFSCPVICGDFLMGCLHTGPLVHLAAYIRTYCAAGVRTSCLPSRNIEPSLRRGVAALRFLVKHLALSSTFTACARFQHAAYRCPGFGTERPTPGHNAADICRHPSTPHCRKAQYALGGSGSQRASSRRSALLAIVYALHCSAVIPHHIPGYPYVGICRHDPRTCTTGATWSVKLRFAVLFDHRCTSGTGLHRLVLMRGQVGLLWQLCP